ncbi:hypothetical protein BC938DRAFT_483931 [Jimgerdemannia flammicorona]|uniref:Thiolase C-terminal domain-containing protein n=1 Tax=Jimgerdemannia flammicorona TaxID=994334 RepID=A0A433QAX0_9FUNG|nr:hypothetical protein BC938DRAFT_483931 [Jimgerdemannia flammicorona]
MEILGCVLQTPIFCTDTTVWLPSAVNTMSYVWRMAASDIDNSQKIFGLDPAKVNIAGCPISLGHPISFVGLPHRRHPSRHLLKPGQFGVAAICNGSGVAMG